MLAQSSLNGNKKRARLISNLGEVNMFINPAQSKTNNKQLSTKLSFLIARGPKKTKNINSFALS